MYTIFKPRFVKLIPKKRLTPLQEAKLINSNSTSTSVREEIDAGMSALDSLRLIGSKKINILLETYVINVAEFFAPSNTNKPLQYKAVQKTYAELSKEAIKLGVLSQIRFATAGIYASFQYINRNPSDAKNPKVVGILEMVFYNNSLTGRSV